MIALVRRGGVEGRRAFERLVSAHQTWLVRLMISLVGPNLAEDVAQEAFVRAYLAIGRFREGDGFRPWLRVIAIRLAYNARREAQTRARYHDAFRDVPRAPALSSDERASERDALLEALARVAYPYREILVLRYLEELQLREISALLNIGLSATKMRLHRAREEFRVFYDTGHDHE